MYKHVCITAILGRSRCIGHPSAFGAVYFEETTEPVEIARSV